MRTLSLEAEQNEVIRRILEVDDATILRKVKSLLNSCSKKIMPFVKEDPVPYQTKAEILANLDEACKELKLNLEGKLEFKPAEELLDEL